MKDPELSDKNELVQGDVAPDDANKRAVMEVEKIAKKKLEEIGEAAKTQIKLIRILEGNRCRRILSIIIYISVVYFAGRVSTSAFQVSASTSLERISFLVCMTVIVIFSLHTIERLNRED